MSFPRLSVLAALLLWCAPPAAAQTVQVRFDDGRVTLSAQNAPLRTVLSEWARVGGTRIVGADRVAGPPLTLELTGVPERQALEIILRSVSGYMAGPRPVADRAASMYDRIMILPTSTPAPAPRPAPTPTFMPQPQPIPQIEPEDPEEDPISDIDPDDLPIRGRPDGPQRFVPPGFNPVVPPTQPDPDDDPQEQPAPVTPNNPFGIAPGSARPGVITPVPQREPQGRPIPDQEP